VKKIRRGKEARKSYFRGTDAATFSLEAFIENSDNGGVMRLLEETGEGKLSPSQVMVFGDSATDLSLFELFPHSVLIPNPRLPVEQRQTLEKAASFTSDSPFGEKNGLL
jgi:hydroxymethylpyrimidine pyrophosphatase-like HAD family hydrolase